MTLPAPGPSIMRAGIDSAPVFFAGAYFHCCSVRSLSLVPAGSVWPLVPDELLNSIRFLCSFRRYFSFTSMYVFSFFPQHFLSRHLSSPVSIFSVSKRWGWCELLLMHLEHTRVPRKSVSMFHGADLSFRRYRLSDSFSSFTGRHGSK